MQKIVKSFQKKYTSNWKGKLFENKAVMKTQPSTYKIEKIIGKIMECN